MTLPLEPLSAAGRAACAAVDDLGPFLADQARANDLDGTFARASIERLTDGGILAAPVGAADGGMGLDSLHDLGVLVARIARYDASAALAVHMHLVLAWYFARSVRHNSDNEAGGAPHREWLRAIGKREMIVCSAVAEGGSAAWAPRSAAARSNGAWQVTGRKILASISPIATHFYTRVQTNDQGQYGTAMIPRTADGVQILDNWNGLGLRGSGSGEVIFSDAKVPADALFIRGTWGQRDWSSLEGRVAALAPLLGVTIGIAEAARALAVASYVAAQSSATAAPQSAYAISSMAEIEVAMTSARSSLRCAWQHVDGILAKAPPRSLSADASRSLMAACTTSGMVVERAATDVVDTAMQLVGARTYHAHHDLARLCRDVRAVFFMRPFFPTDGWCDFVASVATGTMTDTPSGLRAI